MLWVAKKLKKDDVPKNLREKIEALENPVATPPQ